MLKGMTSDTICKFGEFLKNASTLIMHGSMGVNDFFTPAGWITLQNCGSKDVIGLKTRFVVTSSWDNLNGLVDALRLHASPSSLLEEAV
eukprot:71685-Prorocentrum_lima.AAC.1